MIRIRPILFAALAVTISCSGASAQGRTELYPYSIGSATPGHPIALTYGTDGARSDALGVRVYRLPEGRYVDLLRRSESLRESDVRGLVAIARGSNLPPKKDDDWNRTVVLAALPVGTYAVVARVGDAVSVEALNVTTIGLLEAAAYYSHGEAAYLPTDLRTYDRYPQDAEVSQVDDAGSHDLPMAGGVARAQDAAGSNAIVVVRAPDGSIGTAIRSGDESGLVPAGFIQADRPIYRPGDTMSIRAILRAGSIGSYAVPVGTRRVRVQAPDGSNVFDHLESISSFGTLAASIRLPEDAATGQYQVTVGDSLTKSLAVAAYKKPEYELDFAQPPAHVVGGSRVPFTVEAKYFFGRPAAGMKLHYAVFSEPLWYDWWWGPYDNVVQSDGLWEREGRKQIAAGDATTGADGRGRFTIATQTVKQDQQLSISVDGRDASGRTVTTSSSLLVTQASFHAWVAPDVWFGQAGTPMMLRAYSHTYDEDAKKPNVAVHVEIAGRRWQNDKEVRTSLQTLDVTTGANGETSFAWTPPNAGDYIVTSTIKDAAGRIATASSYLWVFGSGDEAWLAPIEQPVLVANKTTVAPGSRAKLAVALPKPNRDVLIVTSTDRILTTQVVRVRGTSATFEVDAPSDATTFNVTALLPNENGVEQATATIRIAPAQRALQVTLTPSKRRYLPGERASFAIRAIDAEGRPQRAEFGVGVIDESIYAVQADDATDPLDALYAGRAYVFGTASWFRPNRGESLKAAGGFARATTVDEALPNSMPQGALAGRAAVPQVRSNFVDTAYWSPSVITDDNGRATVTFDWPDNLTTWRATGIGVTENGDVGRATGSALVTKDFLVRLETPRFLRAGDRSNIVGIAQGLAAHPDIRLQLDPGALGKGPLDATLRLNQFNSADTSWPVVAPGVGSVLLTLSGSDGTNADAMRLPLALEAGTAAEHRRDAGSASTRSAFDVAVPPGYLAGAVHVSLAPSLVAELVQNQRLLDVYPYYCTEQTMSAGLPAVFIGRVLKEAHLAMPADVDASAIVRHAVARLGQLQHEDGSWGWWEYDDAHPFMTAYALYGLAEFRKDGYVVPTGMFDRGIDSLVAQLATANADTLAFWGDGQKGSEWNTRAFMLYALADAAPGRVDRALLERTRSHSAQLNPYAIAVLGLAEHWLGNEDSAKALLAQLDRRAVHADAFSFWRGASWHYAWEDDPIETTAYALRFEVAMGADRVRIDSIVNFLRAQRSGDWWYTTKDTAAAVYALSEAIRPDSSEFSPDEIVRVLVDGHEVRSLHVTEPILDAADASVVVPASLIHNGTHVTFERTGRGALYWSSDAVRYVPTNAAEATDASKPLLARLFAAPPPLAVTRSYTVNHGGAWRVGDEIVVEVTVRSRSDVQYVAIEDPFPAGAEHQPEQGRAADSGWSGVQLLDDRAVFFADRIYAQAPVRIRYTLRVTTPGRYTAPAPTVYAMYGPPVSALGRPQSVDVVP